jgi:O-antigen ligase
VNPNILGMVMVFHAAVLIWTTLDRRRSLLIIPFAWLTALWVILQSERRSALIGWIALCLLSSLAYWKAFLTQAGKNTRTAILISALVLMTVLIGITLHSSARFSTLAAAVFRVDPQRNLLPTIHLDLAAVDPARVYIWKAAVGIWTQQPWLGIGLGAFKHLPEVGQFVHAHNFLLTVLVEQGLIGLGLLIAFVALLIRRMHSWVGTSLLACVGFAQLFDDLTPIIAFPIYMALILGYCLFLVLQRSAQPERCLDGELER